jgi:nucleotide-binding universal stress UspA family protein
MFEKILVAIDGSNHSDSALKAVAEVAKLVGSEVEVLHVVQVAVVPHRVYSSEDDSEASKIVNDAVAQLTKSGVNAVGKIHEAVESSVAREIVKEAHEAEASLIVIGSHGAGDLERVLVGSTANKVLHLATLPVLVIR